MMCDVNFSTYHHRKARVTFGKVILRLHACSLSFSINLGHVSTLFLLLCFSSVITAVARSDRNAQLRNPLQHRLLMSWTQRDTIAFQEVITQGKGMWNVGSGRYDRAQRISMLGVHSDFRSFRGDDWCIKAPCHRRPGGSPTALPAWKHG